MIPRPQNRPPRLLSDAYTAAEKEFMEHEGSAASWSGLAFSYRHGVCVWCFWCVLLLCVAIAVFAQMASESADTGRWWATVAIAGMGSLLGAACLAVLIRRAWGKVYIGMSAQGIEVCHVAAWKESMWSCAWSDIEAVSLSDSCVFLQMKLRDGALKKVYLPVLNRKDRSMLIERIFLQMGPSIQEDGNI